MNRNAPLKHGLGHLHSNREQIEYNEYDDFIIKQHFHSVKADPIACAVHMHDRPEWRDKLTPPLTQLTLHSQSVPFDSFSGRSEFQQVAPMLRKRDVKKAGQIRDYFSKKFLMIQLSGEHLSQYRQELMRMLTRNDDSFTEEETGMIMSLPRLFIEDQFLDELKENYNNDPWIDTTSERDVNRTLTYIGCHTKTSHRYTAHTRYTRKNEFTCNWFHDEDDRLYLIETDTDSPYRMIWQDLIQYAMDIKGDPVKCTKRDGMHYYELHNWFILNK